MPFAVTMPLAPERNSTMQTKICYSCKFTYRNNFLSLQILPLQKCGAKMKLYFGTACQVLLLHSFGCWLE